MEFNEFTNQYKLNKTLRFELRPQGRTLELIRQNAIISSDEGLAEAYQKVKKIIDEYHRYYIETQLANLQLQCEEQKDAKGKGKFNSLAEYYALRSDESDSGKKNFKKVKELLRKQVSDCLQKSAVYKTIFKKELIQVDLINFVNGLDISEEEKSKRKKLIELFNNFTSYFVGFHQNRENMYTFEEKSTSIAYRLINENLPKFIDNISVFDKISEVAELKDKINQLTDDFSSYLGGVCVENVFKLEYFNKVVTQRQIEVYNALIGGRSEGDKKIQGLNEYINLYNQKHAEARLPRFKVLYKQILSDREPISWLPEQFNRDGDLLNAVREYQEEMQLVAENIKVLLGDIRKYDLEGVFVSNDTQLTAISKALDENGDWGRIQRNFIEYYKSQNKKKKNEGEEKYYERMKDLYDANKSFSLSEIFAVAGLNVEEYFANMEVRDPSDETGRKKINVFDVISCAYSDAESLFTSEYPKEKHLISDEGDIKLIKSLLDAWKSLQHFVKPLLGTGDEPAKDNAFYGEFYEYWDKLNELNVLYNMVRNYLTRKPYSDEKIKLNFRSAQLLGGWDQNKETDCLSVLLMKDGKYYLGIMNKRVKEDLDYEENKGNNKIFATKLSSAGDCYQKVVYKLLPGANKMLPKVFFSESRISEFAPSAKILHIRKIGSYKSGDTFNLDDCYALIDFYKKSLNNHEDWSKFNFEFPDTSEYNNINEFFEDVERQGYKVEFQPISKKVIDDFVNEGKLYLFEIYNKDFSEHSKGTPNLHTIYWKMLFDERNLKNVVYQLNGQAEVFFRKKSLDNKFPTHPKGTPIRNKNKQNPKKESVFEYDLIKNKRYTEDKFLFHVPITLNFKSGKTGSLNLKVREYIKEADDLHVIGIDRGERNLLYVVVIDKNGNICEQISLNQIGNINYHNLLDEREEDRQKQRENWKTIEGIKDLKQGYLSQAVRIIADLMVKYKAIVVLENLNLGFMRGRQKVEKSVYQQFEKMLIEKLNYLVDKKADPTQPGGALKAYQLTNKFESFRELRGQCGFLFYIPAWNTSKIDPATGFVNMLNPRYESVEKSKDYIGKFEAIRYNAEKDYFEFEIDYNKFTDRAEGTRLKWTLCSYGTRIENYIDSQSGKWASRTIVLTDEFKRVFKGLDINGDLKKQILAQSEKAFFEELYRALRLLVQLRNSEIQEHGESVKEPEDYILSPVANSEGVFFDSRKADESMPKDADANGAYNIARKGLMIVNQVKNEKDLANFKSDLTNKNWLNFAQEGK